MLMAVETLFLITISMKYIYVYWQPNPTHSLCLFLPLLDYFRCGMLLKSPHLIYCTAYTYSPSPYTYCTPYSVLAFSCDVNNCHHRHGFLFHYSTSPCNSNPKIGR